MNDGRLFTMRLRYAPANLLYQVNSRFDWNELSTVRAPEFVETAAWHMLHREKSASPIRGFKDVGIENTDDVRMFDMCQQDCLTEHFLNLVEIHADPFENFHRLPAEKAVFDTINLRERAFAQKAFHFVGVANYLAIFEQAHILETIVGNRSRKVKISQSQRGMFSIDSASVCGRRKGKVERRRRDGGNEAGAQRRRQAADGSPPLMRSLELPLVTNARFCGVERASSRGIRGDGQPGGAQQTARWSRWLKFLVG